MAEARAPALAETPEATSRIALLAELGAGAVSTVALLYVLRHTLFQPVTRTFGHDLIFWYPVWQFYAEGLSLGELRFWNPLSYGGVPLYPALLQLRVFDPISFLVIVAGNLITPDLLARYNWDLFLRAWIPAIAAHVFLRRFAVEPLTRIALVVVTLCSSFLLVLLRVHGAGQGFLWAPFLGILLYRLLWLGDGRWRVFAGLAVFLGLNWQSYFVVPHATFAGLFALGLILCDSERARRVLRVPRLVPKMIMAGLILAVMAVPLAVVVGESGEVVYLPRLLDTARPAGKVGPIQYEPIPSPAVREVGPLMPREFFVTSGTPSTIWNFLQLATPTGNWHREGGHGWGNPSEAFMYLGLPVYATALFGLWLGRHPLWRTWALVLGAFGLLMLGPLGGVQTFLAFVFPPLRLIRHSHTYTPYFQLALLFFFVLGADRLLAALRGRTGPADRAPVGNHTPRWLVRVLTVVGAAFLVYLVAIATPTAFRAFPAGKAMTPAVLAVGLAALWWLRRRLSATRMFTLCLLGHLAAVPLLLTATVLAGLHTPPAGGLLSELVRIGLHWLVFLLVPFVIYRAGLRLAPGQYGLISGLLLALLAADALFYLTYTDYLWHWPRPHHALGVTADATPLRFPDTRRLYPPEVDRTLDFGQAIRYPELLLRRPYLLTAPRDTNLPDPAAASLESLRTLQRWNSFYVPRRYLWLLHSQVPAPVSTRIWGLGEPIVRFVPDYVVVEDTAFERVFRELGPERGRCLLARATVLPEARPDLQEARPLPAEGAGGCEPEAGPGATVTVTGYAADRLRVEVEAPSPGFLVISDGYHPRWTARVDARPAPLLRADYLRKAVPVPAGTHSVTFQFDPGTLLPGLGLFTFLGLSALLGATASALCSLLRALTYHRRPRLQMRGAEKR